MPDLRETISNAVVSVDVVVDLSRIRRNREKAQLDLDNQVMTDMTTLMPRETGSFIQITKAKSEATAGTGKVYAAAGVYGRFLYMGKTMVDPNTGSTWAKRDVEKVLVDQYTGKTNAREDLILNQSKNPDAVPKWFLAAKDLYLDDWVKLVDKDMKRR